MNRQLQSSAVRGYLRLAFVYDEKLQQTRMTTCEQQAPLKVIRAFPLPAGGALVHLHNLSGGVLGGDQLSLNVEVGPHAHTQLTSTSATRLYRSLPEAPIAVQTNAIQVQEDGLLEYLPDPIIPFAGSYYKQYTHIELAHNAGLFWWETIAPGRTARGELFDYKQLQLGLDITASGKLLARERLKLEPGEHAFSSLAQLGPYSYFCSFYICRIGLQPDYWSHLERDLNTITQELNRTGEISWGVSTLVAHGLVVRGLSRQGRDITTGLLTFWQAAKQALYGKDAIPPRKIY